MVFGLKAETWILLLLTVANGAKWVDDWVHRQTNEFTKVNARLDQASEHMDDLCDRVQIFETQYMTRKEVEQIVYESRTDRQQLHRDIADLRQMFDRRHRPR